MPLIYTRKIWDCFPSLSSSLFLVFTFALSLYRATVTELLYRVLSLQTRPCICIAHISFFITIIMSISVLCIEHNAACRSLPVTFASRQREHSRLLMAPSKFSARETSGSLISLLVETHYRTFTLMRYEPLFNAIRQSISIMERGVSTRDVGGTMTSVYRTGAVVVLHTNLHALKIVFKHEEVWSIEFVMGNLS